MKVKCALGGEDIDTNAFDTFQKVTGWAERRKSGGANAIRQKTVHEEWCCRAHLDMETKERVSAVQQRLM